jgi:signal peptide peptidase SppA
LITTNFNYLYLIGDYITVTYNVENASNENEHDGDLPQSGYGSGTKDVIGSKSASTVSPIPVYIPPVNQGGGGNKKSFFGTIVKTIASSVIIGSIFLNIYLGALLFASMGNQDSVYMKSDALESKSKIAIIPLEASMINMETASIMRRMFKKAIEDELVKAVILRVNCPGGQVAPSNMINKYLSHYQEETGNKVYVSIQQLGASGAYWISAKADRIYAQENSLVGSIGVIAMNFIVEEILKEKLGIQPVIYKSSRSPFKDHNTPFRMPTVKEKEDMIAELDIVHGRFVEVIAEGRANLSEDDVWALANGDIFDGPEALENGLIDKIGFIEDVITDIKEEQDIDPQVVVYAPPMSLKDQILGSYSQLSGFSPLEKAFEITANSGAMVIYPQGYYQRILKR